MKKKERKKVFCTVLFCTALHVDSDTPSLLNAIQLILLMKS